MRTPARLCLVLASISCAAAAGCYSKVVGAQGPGADTTRIQEPNAPAPDGRTLGYPRYKHRTLPGS